MSQEQNTPPEKEGDKIQAALSASAQQGLTPDLDFDDLPEPLPQLDEGPEPRPVDDIQDALIEAAQKGVSTELDFNDLPTPPLPPLFKEGEDFDELPELDEGPQPGPVDDIQGALIQAAQAGVRTEVDLDDLPPPGKPEPPQKVIHFKQRDTATRPTPRLSAPPDPLPLTYFPEPGPARQSADFGLALALFVAFRLLSLFLLRPGGYLRDWSDFDTFFGIASLSDYGLRPFLNFWLEWPPLLPWLTVGAYKLSLFCRLADDPAVWFILI
ncbi:MAG: hypothetical protein HC875_10555 [Anaerolineales bacterium]|nr:hypothetical protein [Anaerolineales bacterium]